MGLLGDKSVELFLRNNTVEVQVSTLNHFLESIIISEFSKILGDFSEVLESNEASFLSIKGNEDLVNLVTSLVVGGAGCHHVEKFFKLDLSAAVLIKFSDHLIDSLGLGLDTEGVDGDLEFCIKGLVPLGSMAPPRSRSNRSKAFLISSTSSWVT